MKICILTQFLSRKKFDEWIDATINKVVIMIKKFS